MLSKKLIAVALVSALGLSVSVAQARDFDHRDHRGSGYTAVSRHGDFRHGHHVRHSHHRHHAHRGFR